MSSPTLRPGTRIGLQVPNFDYPGVPPERLFEHVAGIANQAEHSGFDSLLVMDHFYQLPALGPPDGRMFESYALLSALAARTQRLRLGALVSSNSYRNPAHLAKVVTSLDVISGGRAILGIGAGWFEPEHVGYGFPFPPVGERLDRLEEALAIIRPMLRGDRPSFEGRHYRTVDAINSPAPLQAGGPPILVGGAGEKRTLRLAARYADESNLPCPIADVPRKLEALAKHCAAVGRDRRTLRTHWLGSLVLAPSQEAAEALRNDFLRQRGMDWATLGEPVREMIDRALVLGDPDTVGEFVERQILGRGLDGIVVNLPANGHDPEAVALAGETLGKAFG